MQYQYHVNRTISHPTSAAQELAIDNLLVSDLLSCLMRQKLCLKSTCKVNRPTGLHNLISVHSCRTRFSSSVTRSLTICILLVTNHQPLSYMYMHHLTCGISSLLHSVNHILFILLLIHLILRISITSPPSFSPSFTPSIFHSRLKTHLFHESFPS